MKNSINITLSISVVFLSLSVTAQNAEVSKAEMSVVRTANDKNLQWGPCPPFLPSGCAIAVLHGDPSKPNVDVFLKIPADSELPNHIHNSAERMILVEGELDVKYQGENSQTLKAGSYAYGPAKKPHVGKCSGAGPCILFIAFEAPLDAIPVNK